MDIELISTYIPYYLLNSYNFDLFHVGFEAAYGGGEGIKRGAQDLYLFFYSKPRKSTKTIELFKS